MRLIRESHLGRVVEPSPAPDVAAARGTSHSVDDAWWGLADTPDAGPAPPLSMPREPHHSKASAARMSQLPMFISRTSQPQHESEPPLGLSQGMWRHICADPRAARLVEPVWSRLAELELAGHDAGALAALRYTLTLHQPTRRGACRVCRWQAWPFGWWRRRWPCATWIQIRAELLGAGIARSY